MILQQRASSQINVFDPFCAGYRQVTERVMKWNDTNEPFYSNDLIPYNDRTHASEVLDHLLDLEFTMSDTFESFR